MDSKQRDEDEYSNTLFENGPESETLRAWVVPEEDRINEETIKNILDDAIQRENGDEEEVEEEEFRTNVSNPPDPRKVSEALRRSEPIPVDRLMKNVFGIMTELSKELLRDEEEEKQAPQSSDESSTPVELGELSTWVKRLCILLVGTCVWFVRILGIRGKFGFMDSLYRMIKSFEEEISKGDYDEEFASLGPWIKSRGFYLLPEFIEGVCWTMNRIMNHPFLSGFLLGIIMV